MPQRNHAASAGLKRYTIRICSARQSAQHPCLSASQAQAWATAFDLAERLLGNTPAPHSISVSQQGRA